MDSLCRIFFLFASKFTSKNARIYIMNDFDKTFEKNYKMLNGEQRSAVDTIDGPVLVIAGPGTGKTQLLSTRIANILRQTDTSAENILAMTFTDAGAQNMRERLSTLIGAESYKVGIFTYHGFANEIIQNYREFFLDKNLENQADDLKKLEILESVKEKLPTNSGLKYVELKNFAKVISEMKRALITSAELKYIAQANIAEQDSFHQKIKGLRVSGSSFAKVEPFYRAVREALKSSISNQLDGAKFKSNLYFYLEKLNEAFLDSEETGKSNSLTSWRNKFLKEKDGDDNFQVTDVYKNKKLLEFADFYENFNTEMKAQGLYDFDDMILEVIDTVEKNDDLRFTLQEKYQYILLDEYQDTNDAQAKMIELLTDNPVFEGKPNVLAVGDDDQAIMAFQGASKSNMIDFYNRFGENTKVINLTKNYRSHGDILSSSKKVADTISGRLTKNLPIAIEKDISAEKDFSGEEIKIERINFASQIAEFSWAAEEISELIKNGIPANEIAVIAPKHKILQALSPYLKNRNVPIKYDKRENILEDKIISQLIKISKLVLAIRDKDETQMAELFPEVLSFDFWKIPTVEAWKMSWLAKDKREFWIEAILESDCLAIQRLGEILVALAELSYNNSFEEMFDYILGSRAIFDSKDNDDQEILKSPIRDYLSDKSDEEFFDIISNLTVLRDHLREFSKEQNNDLSVLIKFADAYNKADLKIVNTNPHSSSENAVQLMTPFVAKGLEFDHVFLLSLNQEVWNRSSGGSKTISMPINLKFTNIQDEGEDTRKRLLFVAMTRAKTHLYLTNYTSDFSGKNTKSLAFLDEREEDKILKSKILPERWQNISHDKKDALEISDLELDWHEFYAAKNESMRNLLRPRIQNFKMSPTNLNSFIDIEYGGPQAFYENNILCFPEAYGASATLGTLVHDGFNYIQDKINANEIPSFDILRNRFIERISKYPISEKDRTDITERFDRIFSDFFDNRLNKFKAGNIAEKNFSNSGVVIGDALLTGKIDLIRIDREDKKIVVVDYKTGSIPLKNGKIDKSNSKIHKYEQQLYFYKILIENTPEFAGYQIEKGIIEFIEPSNKTGETYNYEVCFDPEKENDLKLLIQAVWSRIKNFNFEFETDKYPKNLKGIKRFEADLIEEFENR